MTRFAKPTDVRVGDRIRFSNDMVNWAISKFGDCDTSVDQVKSIRVSPECPEEYWSFHFSKIPGDCFIFPLSPIDGIEFPLVIED